jgi:predicted DNA-binding protein
MENKRVQWSTRLDSKAIEKLSLLSSLTRIPQSRLVDESLDDLFEKYKDYNPFPKKKTTE